MTKVLAKVGNVYFASRWFSDRQGNLKEGEAITSSSKMVARRYNSIDLVERDAKILGIALDSIEFEKVA